MNAKTPTPPRSEGREKTGSPRRHGGPAGGLASTVVDLSRYEETGHWRVLREGAWTDADIEEQAVYPDQPEDAQDLELRQRHAGQQVGPAEVLEEIGARRWRGPAAAA